MKTLSKKMLLLSLLGLVWVSENSFAACQTAPDCATLGYTQSTTDCDTEFPILKCPFDTNKAVCRKKAPISILYGDGTISSQILADKKPIGVVFDEKNRLAIALTDIKQDGSAGTEGMLWSSEVCDTPNLENCPVSTLETCGVDGRANTDAILASTCNGTTYAANAVNAYQTSNCSANFCKKGKWFLPSVKDLGTVFSYRKTINNLLTLLAAQGANQLHEDFIYWSSTERDINKVWRRLYYGSTSFSYKHANHLCVRPVIKF